MKTLKLKRVISVLLVCFMLVGVIPFSFLCASAEIEVWDGSVAESFGGGSGTKEDPYLITNASEFAYYIQIGDSSFINQYFKLTADIYLNDEAFAFDADTGLVKITDGVNTAFIGTGFKGDDSGENTVFDATASVVGTIYSSDTECVEGEYGGEINSWTLGALNGFFDGGNHTIFGLYINTPEEDEVGLFETSAFGRDLKNLRLEQAFVCGNNFVGGFIGYATHYRQVIENCYSSAIVVSKGNNTGGFVGGFEPNGNKEVTFEKCVNAGTVMGNGYVGGFVGILDVVPRNVIFYIFNNCYNSGNIYANLTAGGFVGFLDYRVSTQMNNCYNAGNVYGRTLGAFVANMSTILTEDSGYAYFENCYYLMGCAVNGTQIFSAFNKLQDVGVYTKTAKNLQSKDTFDGFDFDSVWEIDSNAEYPYPTLRDVKHNSPLVDFDVTSSENKVWEGEIEAIKDGSGTKEDPYLISNAEQLAFVASCTKANVNFNNVHFKIAADIRLNDETFTFIPDTGLVKITDGTNIAFYGTGIKGDDSGENTVFDTTPSVMGKIYSSDESIEEGSYSGEIYEWTPIGKKLADPHDGKVIGGFSGIFDGGNHAISGLFSGSLFGYVLKAEISNVCVGNSLTSTSGIINTANDLVKIENCCNFATVAGISMYCGGIIGELIITESNEVNIKNCFNAGVVYGKSGLGGLVGGVTDSDGKNIKISVSFENCYNSGNVVKSASGLERIGGFIAKTPPSVCVSMAYCYNVGSVIKQSSEYVVYQGAFIGIHESKDSPVFVNCYYKVDSVIDQDGNIIYRAVHNYADTQDVKYLIGSQLFDKEYYEGFDFENVWIMDEQSDYPYPMLQYFVNTPSENCNHSYAFVVVTPSCEDERYVVNICHCGNTVVGETLPSCGHSYSSVVVEPTCTDEGCTVYTCHCGNYYVDDFVDANGHTEGEWTVVEEPKIGVEGLEEQCCSGCGAQIATRPIDALEGYALGDVNGDGEIDKKDYAILKRYCFGTMELDEAQLLASDVNGDGEVDKKDYAMLKRHCFGTAEI